MAQALIFKAPAAMTAPGNAPRLIHSLVNAAPARRYVAATSTAAIGGAVSSLTDLSGSGVALNSFTSVPTSTPTLRQSGKLRYLEFDGVDDRMETGTVGTPATAQPLTVMIVGRYRAANATDQPLASLHANASGRHIGKTAGGFLQGQFSTIVTTDVAVDLGWHVFTMVANGASSVLAMDATERTVNLGTATAAGLTIGRNSAATAFGQIDIAELVIWPTALDATQRANELANLKTSYGI